MIAGRTDLQGRTWFRCTECGDSRKHQWKAHAFADKNGGTYCFICGHSSQLSIEALIDIAIGDASIDDALQYHMAEREHAALSGGRPTLLPKFQVLDDAHADAFEMRSCNGDRTGWHLRYLPKRMANEGQRGIGFVGDSLTSSPSRPLVVVEGPYDIISERNVCVFGTICRSALRHLRLQYCWLFPDPDQVDTVLKRERFVTKVVKPAVEEGMVLVQGVILGNDDPDKATKLVHVPLSDIDHLPTFSY